MKVLLTFLGTGKYQPCRYQINGLDSPEVTFFSHALAASLQPQKIISLQTKGAQETHGAALHEALGSLKTDHQAVPIPDGKDEVELWELFRALTEHIPPNCALHLDITHGFRSLPLLGFLALSYLRVTRKASIGGIHYGAWEARDERTKVAPAFDLTPFLTLLDWTAAAEQFLTTGLATHLGNLLCQAQQKLWKSAVAADKSDLPTKLKNLGASLKETSANLLLLRTGALADSVRKLESQLQAAKQEADDHTVPFLELLDPVKDQLLSFRDTDLATLRDLVGWLAERGQTAAALTLASEWLTSYVMVKCGQPDHHTSYQTRKPYSLAISKLEQPDMIIEPDDTGKQAEEAIETLKQCLTKEEMQALVSVASTIRSARNDLNHAGFNGHAASALELQKRAKEVADNLKKLHLSE